MPKRAFVTGLTGQDGAYLAQLLLSKGYEVFGTKRRSSSFNTARIDAFFERLHVHYADLTDGASLGRLLAEIRPDEIYNLGAQSHVAVSFEVPEYTMDTNALGVIRLLEAIRAAGLTRTTRFYQASSSELFGDSPPPQNETTPFRPRSPYAIAKLAAYWAVVNYREAYGLHASNGILFNHESPLRGETFVTRKITRALARMRLDPRTPLHLGNLDAVRDWGHARDYVEAMWPMLQQDEPDDYVIATGTSRTVRDFIATAARVLGLAEEWVFDHIIIDPRYFRPTEVAHLCGDARKAQERLGWEPKTSFRELVEEMCGADLAAAKQERAPCESC